VISTLSRYNRRLFCNIGGGYWGLADWPSDKLQEERQIRTQKKKIAVNAVDKASSLMRMINQFDTKLETLPVGKGIKGGFAGFWEETRARIPILKQAYPKATTTIDSLQAQRPQIARGMGDVGNMTEREQASATKFVPHVSDADDTRLFKSLGGYALTRAKIIDAVELAGMTQDPQYKSRLAEIDREIEKRIKKLENMGYERNEVINFIGGELDEFDYTIDPFGKFRKRLPIEGEKGKYRGFE